MKDPYKTADEMFRDGIRRGVIVPSPYTRGNYVPCEPEDFPEDEDVPDILYELWKRLRRHLGLME